jgi:hypothetical protein
LREQRKKIWIDRFQTTLSLRIALYFVLYVILVWLAVVIERSIYGQLEMILGPASRHCFAFLAFALIGVGLLFIYDAVKYTHRIVGPLSRFQKTIKAIAAGEELELVNLRKGDLLQEMKNDINEMLKALEQRGAVVLKTNRDQKQPLPV